MQTKEKWFLSFVTGAGNLDNEVLKTDIERLTAFYYDHGYIDVKIDEPVVERTADGPARHHQDRRGRPVQGGQRSTSAASCSRI